MPIVILIPAVLCMVLLARAATRRAPERSAQRTFLNFFLPIFMMFPVYYYWKVANLPPIDLAEAALFPLGVGMVLFDIRRWRFAPMDLFVLVFLFSSFYADSLHGRSTAAIFELFSGFTLIVVPYMAGKLLIEHNGMRIPFLKRGVFLLFLASILSVYEYRMEDNPFTHLFSRLFPGEQFAWKTQVRWGFGRVSGPFGQSELAGMMFFAGLVLTLWLSHNHLWEPKFRRARWLPFRKSTIIAATLLLVLAMTQARGPWIGAVAALAIALIGRARNTFRTAVVVLTLAAIGGTGLYLGLKAYTSGPTTSDEQNNAQYREQLLDNYIPVAEAGGAWGWGQDFPRARGQASIDNEYLFVALTQGMVGFVCFCLIALEAVWNTVMAAIRSRTQADRYFALSLAGILVGVLVTVFTVFLGNQPYELFFLLAGWSQAIRVPSGAANLPYAIPETASPALTRRVYT